MGAWGCCVGCIGAGKAGRQARRQGGREDRRADRKKMGWWRREIERAREGEELAQGQTGNGGWGAQMNLSAELIDGNKTATNTAKTMNSRQQRR